jgi:type II secretory pathway pseudopilin PulG
MNVFLDIWKKGAKLRNAHCAHRAKRRDRGFTLVMSLMLMMLLMLLGMAMLSLSAVSLRTSGQSQAMKTAQANARMALFLALGELQRTMGPDQSVSASAAAVHPQPLQPRLTGAWSSWRWDPNSNSITTPNYSEKSRRFRKWLISAPPGEAEKFDFANVAPSLSGVDLVGERTDGMGQSTRVTAHKLTTMTQDRKLAGSYAWAVFDESTKAAIDLPEVALLDRGQEIASRTAPYRFRADILDLSNLAHLRTPQNFISLETPNLLADRSMHEQTRRRFHDLTTNSVGLLTDTASGGLKQDLSALLSNPAFNLTNITGSNSSPQLYSTSNSGAVRWQFLHDHYHQFNDSSLTQQRNMPVVYQGTNSLTPSDQATLSITRAPSPTNANLLPSIAKLQVVFSLVTHPCTDGAWLSRAPEAQRSRYATPMIIYEALVTLHNPYDVALRFDHLRFRVWNPPVGFRFAKITGNSSPQWLRAEWRDNSSSFHGLGRFNRAGEGDTAMNNQRIFTVQLSDGTSAAKGNQMLLQPGEVKVYSARLERNWVWAWEPWPGRIQFLDHYNSDDMAGAGNRDRRTNNIWGVEAVPGWDVRGGLRMNHISVERGIHGVNGGRPVESYYPFEDQFRFSGDVNIHHDDEVLVQLQAQRTTSSTDHDFRVDLLAGKVDDNSNIAASGDLLRSYRFRFNDPIREISANPNQPVIQRRFIVGDLLQTLNDPGKGGKKPLAMLEMTARTTRDVLDDSKAWLYNNPVTEGGDIVTSSVGLANQSHDLRLIELTGWSTAPMIEWDAADGEGSPGYGRGFFGASRNSAEGVTNVPMYRIPIGPAVSLGDWVSANLVTSSRLPRVVHAFGNSRAHPLIAPNLVSNPNLNGTNLRGVDHSYFLNDTLWDRYYFSSIADTPALPWLSAQARTWQQTMRDVLDSQRSARNPRIIGLSSSAKSAEIVKELEAMTERDRSRAMSQHLAIKGPFNLNSTSVDAWQAVLSSLRDQVVHGWGNSLLSQPGQTPFARVSMPLAGPNQVTQDVNLVGQMRWAGFRALTDSQIRSLAEAIVGQIRARGNLDQAPPLSLGEFVNRRVAAAGQLQSLAGILQTAIDVSGINAMSHALDSKSIAANTMPLARRRGVQNIAAMNGLTGEGAPSMVTQGDLMTLLAPIATVRGDTFKIRAYGDALAPDGQTVVARAWCEATVQRMPEWVDARDQPTATLNNPTSPLKPLNLQFGRRFQITSFRWLQAREL